MYRVEPCSKKKFNMASVLLKNCMKWDGHKEDNGLLPHTDITLISISINLTRPFNLIRPGTVT